LNRRYVRILATFYFIILFIILIIKVPGRVEEQKVGGAPIDKVFHIAAYALLATIWGVCYWPKSIEYLPIVHAIASESLQMLIPWRTFSPIDLLANGCGVSFGFLLVLIYKVYWKCS